MKELKLWGPAWLLSGWCLLAMPCVASDPDFLVPVAGNAFDPARGGAAQFLVDPDALLDPPGAAWPDPRVDALLACQVDDIRLGGQPGDAFIGPTCNADRTYRTCYYVSGHDLPGTTSAYSVRVDGVPYPVAFASATSTAEVVICASGLPQAARKVDVAVGLDATCSGEKRDLYNGPRCPPRCDVDALRLGGAPGDAYIGPTCNADGNYRSCYYMRGRELPADNPAYQLKLDGVPYPIAFTQLLSPMEVVVCGTDLPARAAGVDVFIQVDPTCPYQKRDFYDAPDCPGPACDIADIRLGGAPGDAYIGPTCSGDGTYRSCYYVTGPALPPNNPAYSIRVDNVSYPIVFTTQPDPTTVVLCTAGLPPGARGVDVSAGLTPSCAFDRPNLYDAPPVCPTCDIQDIRVGGAPGDAFIGPTCSGDGTYRTCLYVGGQLLPPSGPDYLLMFNNVSYPIAFTQALSSTQVVVCGTGLPTGVGPVDAFVRLTASCERSADRLFTAPAMCARSTSRRNPPERWDNLEWQQSEGCRSPGDSAAEFLTGAAEAPSCRDAWTVPDRKPR